jgi:rhamnosyltransferase
VPAAESAGFNVELISPGSFNHGATRQHAVDNLSEYHVVVYLTQDAILCSKTAVEQLLKYMEDEMVAAVCGRQLPRINAKPIEAHARQYNYAAQSSVRSRDDVAQFGLKTAFISNSFAAYRISLLNAVGGFPADVIFGEDMFVAARMLKAGYKIAYAADACVYHSHDYTLLQELKRYFDMGVFHATAPWIRADFGGAEGEGVKFIISELKYLFKNSAWLIPEGMLRILLCYMGFRLGLINKNLPLWLKLKLAMNKGYFK